MYYLIKYTGEIRLNQVGINYEFPHYSTVLGALLAAYHKYKKTPKYPRQDMYSLASILDLKLSILSSNANNRLALEYVQYRNMEKKIKIDDNPASPGNRHIIKGEFYFLISSTNEDLMKALITFPLKVGSNDGTVVSYGIEVFNEIKDFQSKYDQKLYFLNNKKEYLFETNYRQNGQEICLVSQIQTKEEQNLFAQGIYSICEWEELSSYFDYELVSYKDIFEETNKALSKYIDKINASVKEVLE